MPFTVIPAKSVVVKVLGLTFHTLTEESLDDIPVLSVWRPSGQFLGSYSPTANGPAPHGWYCLGGRDRLGPVPFPGTIQILDAIWLALREA